MVNITLPASLEHFVRSKVEDGDFHTADEVVCEGLRLLQQQEQWKVDARQKIEVGLRQAQEGQLSTADEVRRRLDTRKQGWKEQNPR